jgi:hypothetical protein
VTFPGLCPSGTRFGWTSFECVPTAFSLPSLLEDRFSSMSEPPAPTAEVPATSSSTSVLAVGGLLLGMVAAAAIGIAVANADTRKTKTP